MNSFIDLPCPRSPMFGILSISSSKADIFFFYLQNPESTIFFFFNLINCDNVLIKVEPFVYFNSNILEIIISLQFGEVPLAMGISFQM